MKKPEEIYSNVQTGIVMVIKANLDYVNVNLSEPNWKYKSRKCFFI